MFFVAKKRLRQRARQLGLSDPGGAQEQEAADRSVRVAEPGPAHDGRPRPPRAPPRPARPRAAWSRSSSFKQALSFLLVVSSDTGMPVARDTIVGDVFRA